MKNKHLQIRNSTAEFLIFTSQAGENTIEVMVQDETVWLTQKMIAALFDSTKQNVGQHLKKIFEEGELLENSVVKNFFTTAEDGKQYNCIVQDKLFESDFDKAVKNISSPTPKKKK
jgi:hypothetical protein